MQSPLARCSKAKLISAGSLDGVGYVRGLLYLKLKQYLGTYRNNKARAGAIFLERVEACVKERLTVKLTR